jgi:Arc/MetJ-type ribon-helix-helix transcriptional regulator
MEKTKMKRVNLILDSDLYDKARAMAFLRRASISEIVRKALREWLEKNLDKKAEILLSETEEKRLLKILETDEFIPSSKVKMLLGL